MFYLDLVRLYEFKENNYTEAARGSRAGPVAHRYWPETYRRPRPKNNPRAKVDDHLRIK